MLKIQFLIFIFCFFCGLFGERACGDSSVQKVILPAKRFLYLDPGKNGVKIMPLHFVYRVSDKSLTVGDFEFNEKSFSVLIDKFKNVEPKLAKAVESERKDLMLFNLPKNLIESGVLEVISRSGEVIWSRDLNNDDFLDWKDKLVGFGESLLRAKAKRNPKSPIWTASYGAMDLEVDENSEWVKESPLRACWTYSSGKYFTRACTGKMSFKKVKVGVYSLVTGDMEPNEPRVLLNHQSAPLAQDLEVDLNKDFQFYSELADGYTYEFFVRPRSVMLVDYQSDQKSNVVKLKGHTYFPMGFYEELLSYNPKGVSAKVGWLPTIGDTKKYWSKEIKESEPWVYLQGDGGGVFKQPLDITHKPPPNSFKIQMDDRSILSTYSDEPILVGKISKGYSVSSKENSVTTQTSDESTSMNSFEWKFKADEPFVDHTRTLLVQSKLGNWEYNYTLYRTVPRELSARLSAVVGANLQTLSMGELAYNQWFESLAGWRNYTLSTQRWGISMKYFQSLTPMPESQVSSEKVNISVATLDLKYRLVPGTWGRDETWGLLGGYENIQIGSVGGGLVGGGFFWARSMPLVFDQIFDLVPVMRYPKWVDMELVFYPMKTKANTVVGTNYALNFHGKVLWSHRVFGEAGFGIKSFDLGDLTIGKKAGLSSFYATVGLGLSF